jgi:hypothetical protein
VSPAHPADSLAKDFLLDKVAPGVKADAMDNKETNKAAKEANAADAAVLKKAASGTEDKEVTHTDEANSAAPDNKETSNADEAEAAYASALKNAASGVQDMEETNSADAVDREETNNADEGQAAHPSNRRAMDSTVLNPKEYLLSKQEATRHSKKEAKRHSHSAKSKNAAKATVPLEFAPAAKKKGGRIGGSLLASSPRLSKGDFCRSHPCSFLAVGDKRRGLGGTASLDEAGYKSVAELKDDEEMKQFILRVVEDYDCKVDKMGGLMGIVPWFSGTTAVQSLEKLNESLLFAVLANGERWISFRNTAGVTGADVPLDLEGYVEVAIIRSAGETEKFARRLAEQMGIEITREGGFEGMIKYYDGSATFQSFDKLREEMRSAAASPNTWAKFKSM